MILEHITSPDDVKQLDASGRAQLIAEMRHALLQRASAHGGHVGPDLGFVEATVALHTVFSSPRDKFVFDVSHQSYPHKMLTGRQQAYTDPAHYDDVSGYTNPQESEHDFFNIGHTSTSIALAAGLAKARDLAGRKEDIIAIIGDGSLSGGEALEGLNVAGELGTNFIIVVNDNDMSIAENHGGMYDAFRELRETEGRAQNNLFRAMGLDYRFVKDGNDVEALIKAFEEVRGIDHPVVVHIVTQKGRGYRLAEENREAWHWHMPFDLETGEETIPSVDPYAQQTVQYLLQAIKDDPDLVVLTAGVPSLMGFKAEQRLEAGRQFVDVGIAEEAAVAMASGLAKGGARPVFGTFSTFFQRTYDQLSQDVCINGNPAVFLVFGASAFALNDVTHLGLFDIPMMSNIPELVCLSPTSPAEYQAMLAWAIRQTEHPVAIRVPVLVPEGLEEQPAVRTSYDELNRSEVIHRGSQAAILGLGNFLGLAKETATLLAEQGLDVTVINPIFTSGLDEALLESLKEDHRLVITLEDGCLAGGFGEKVARFYGTSAMRVKSYGYEKKFYDRYDVNDLLKASRLTKEQLAEDIAALLS